MFKIQKYSPLYSFVFEKQNRKNTQQYNMTFKQKKKNKQQMLTTCFLQRIMQNENKSNGHEY